MTGVRALGIDLGSRRIGIAVSDRTGVLASAHTVLERSGDPEADRRTMLALAGELEVEAIVVGLPRSMDGSLGPAAQGALAEVEALGALTDLPIETYDERLTTVTADRLLVEQNVDAKARRKVVDMVAAAVMLQSWLDARASRLSGQPTEPEGSP